MSKTLYYNDNVLIWLFLWIFRLRKPPPASTSKATRPNSLTQRTTTTCRGEPIRYVRTLSHRLSADNGHLSFNEGEKLQLVLDVDDKWILCCRGARKGLVPRSSVLMVSKWDPSVDVVYSGRPAHSAMILFIWYYIIIDFDHICASNLSSINMYFSFVFIGLIFLIFCVYFRV